MLSASSRAADGEISRGSGRGGGWIVNLGLASLSGGISEYSGKGVDGCERPPACLVSSPNSSYSVCRWGGVYSSARRRIALPRLEMMISCSSLRGPGGDLLKRVAKAPVC